MSAVNEPLPGGEFRADNALKISSCTQCMPPKKAVMKFLGLGWEPSSIHPIMWFVYIVQAADSSLYTGIAVDPKHREWEHNRSDKGAKALRGKRPVTLVYTEAYGTQAEAAKREAAIKKWKREYKIELIHGKGS